MALTPRPIRGPDFDELDTLTACAREGTLVAAAERLGISRPAVAKRIKNLEALAGQPLLHRGGRGIQLTDAGASLLAASQRVLDGRDVLLATLGEIRGEHPSPIAGLRELLGGGPPQSRSAPLPEARLAETERVLELVLRESLTAVSISDPDTLIIHEVNEAFCRFTGRSREGLVGQRATDEHGPWADVDDRAGVFAELRSAGTVTARKIRIRRPDGSLRVGNLRAHLLSLAGANQVLSTIDDITELDTLETDQTAGVGFYRAVAEASKLLLSGRQAIESIASVLPTIHRSGPVTSVLLWNLEDNCTHELVGDPPPGDLRVKLADDALARNAGVARIGNPGLADGRVSGWAVGLPDGRLALVLLTTEQISTVAQALYEEALADLAILASAAGAPRVS